MTHLCSTEQNQLILNLLCTQKLPSSFPAVFAKRFGHEPKCHLQRHSWGVCLQLIPSLLTSGGADNHLLSWRWGAQNGTNRAKNPHPHCFPDGSAAPGVCAGTGSGGGLGRGTSIPWIWGLLGAPVIQALLPSEPCQPPGTDCTAVLKDHCQPTHNKLPWRWLPPVLRADKSNWGWSPSLLSEVLDYLALYASWNGTNHWSVGFSGHAITILHSNDGMQKARGVFQNCSCLTFLSWPMQRCHWGTKDRISSEAKLCKLDIFFHFKLSFWKEERPFNSTFTTWVLP